VVGGRDSKSAKCDQGFSLCCPHVLLQQLRLARKATMFCECFCFSFRRNFLEVVQEPYVTCVNKMYPSESDVNIRYLLLPLGDPSNEGQKPILLLFVHMGRRRQCGIPQPKGISQNKLNCIVSYCNDYLNFGIAAKFEGVGVQ